MDSPSSFQVFYSNVLSSDSYSKPGFILSAENYGASLLSLKAVHKLPFVPLISVSLQGRLCPVLRLADC